LNSTAFLEIPYWLNATSDAPAAIKQLQCVGRNQPIVTQSFQLTTEETQSLLTRANIPFNTTSQDLLLTALTLSFQKFFGRRDLQILMEGHGREKIVGDVNVSRTIGWFTTEYPVKLTLSQTDSLSDSIIEIKETMRHVLNNGIGYGVLRYLSEDVNLRSKLAGFHPQIVFNYLGEFNVDFAKPLFSVSTEATGISQSLLAGPFVDLEITASIRNQQLIVSFTIRDSIQNETITQLLDYYKVALLEIITHCATLKDVKLTPSDLSYNDISVQDLQTFFD
jgi:non-ribosomal peptide synthase protein (TIGR01720 family)